MIHSAADVPGYFRELLVRAFKNREVSISEDGTGYLVGLLSSVTTQKVDPSRYTLVEQLADAISEPNARAKQRCYRQMGDTALMRCGMFPESLEYRGVSRPYVVCMGRRAYREASVLSRAQRRSNSSWVYGELSDQFSELAACIDEVREQTALRTPQDIVRLYDRYRRTKSPTLARRLSEFGVNPMLNHEHDEVLH
ncbi:MAG: hypothetical protein AAF550_02000 [Myxococcota bacterium]